MQRRSTTSTYRGITQALLVFMLLSAGLFLLALPAQAKTFVVDTAEDHADATIDGTCAVSTAVQDRCSLRAAIQEANALTGADTIFLPAGHYSLIITGTDEDASVKGDLDITGTVTISGGGAISTVIEGGAGWDDRILHFLPGSVALVSGVTISGGKAIDAPGAGILVDGDDGDIPGGQLALVNCRLTNNHGTGSGGGIASSGILTITKCTIDGNSVVGDSASRGGGVFINTSSTLYMGNSTVSQNTAQDEGGGIDIANDAKPPSSLNNVTLVHNTLVETDTDLAQGGGIAIGNGVLTVTNSIIAGNKTGSGTFNDCHGHISVMRYSLLQTPTPDCTTIDTDTTGLITGTLPALGLFGFNGGDTPTYPLLTGSPAVNAGNPAAKNADVTNPSLDPESCFADDQRGETRSDRCDMGAFEVIEEVQQPISDTLFMPILRHPN